MNKIRSAPQRTAGAVPSALWRVLGTAHALEARLEGALANVSLSIAKLGILRSLVEAGGALTLGELAERNQCVRSNITQLVDRLESDGLVRRVNDASDRRIRRATLTAAGRESYAEGTRIMEASERQVSQSLSVTDAQALERVLGRLS